MLHHTISIIKLTLHEFPYSLYHQTKGMKLSSGSKSSDVIQDFTLIIRPVFGLNEWAVLENL